MFRPFRYVFFVVNIFLIFSFCGNNEKTSEKSKKKKMFFYPKKVNEIPLPKNFTKDFKRLNMSKNSFGEYLQNLPLRSENTVYLHNGNKKENQEAQFAVIDINIGKKNLVQCADATMLLRAEYLFAQKRFEEIKFHFSNGFLCEYTKWQAGNRIQVQGNKVNWIKKTTFDESYDTFKKYLEIIYTYSGTLSLPKDTKTQTLDKLQIGDIFLKSGSPGHAVIVMDIAQNSKTKQKIFLLAQSYMPAQDIHILKNPKNQNLSPWYDVEMTELQTPEWDFDKNAVRKW